MAKEKLVISYSDYPSLGHLEAGDQLLMQAAEKAYHNAYAPYSNFKVGASVLLATNQIVIGSNQENVAYPSGLCAERVALFGASANFPNIGIEAIAVYAQLNEQISPCGSCRQVMSEYEVKQNAPIRVLLMNLRGEIRVFDNCESLLPFSFKFF